MEVKLFRILDIMTEIRAMATRMTSEDYTERIILRESGYGNYPVCIFLSMLNDSCRSAYEPFGWRWTDSHIVRTMPTAHEYIENNWHSLTTGDIVDIEKILGENQND